MDHRNDNNDNCYLQYCMVARSNQQHTNQGVFPMMQKEIDGGDELFHLNSPMNCFNLLSIKTIYFLHNQEEYK